MHANHKRLTRQLSLLDVFCIAAGAMISSGLFVLPGLIYAKTGPAVILAYILAGIFVLPALFTKAELATAMPKAGGGYFFVERSMGSVAGVIGGFAEWFSLSIKSAFALVGIGAFAILINPNLTLWQIKLIAAGFCVLFVILNLRSVKLTGRVQILLVILLISLLLLYIFRGFTSLNIHRYTPFIPFGAHTLFAAAGMVFISFGGITKIASIAEEVKNPTKNIPYSMILAFFIVLLLYGLTIFVTVGLLDSHEFAGSLTPISTGGYKIFETFGSVLMSIGAIFAFVSTANAGILAASRYPIAMSRDQILPDFFAQINKKFNTPHFSIIFTGIFMLAVILFLSIENLVEVASTALIMMYMLELLACIVMRESHLMNYKPTFLSPFYPWLQIAGLICYGFLLYEMGFVALITASVFILVSLVWYWIYVHGRATRKSALLHIIERVTAREIASDSLGAELRGILRERDNIIEDRFDKLVKNCKIIDIDKELTLTQFLKVAAEKLARRLNTNYGELFNALVLREKESTTEIRPGLAIPHIIIEGKHKFDLLIARCKSGVNFVDDMPPVYAVFILVGTRDERNFHLRVLSAIAQIVEDANFDRNWLRARNIDELRDIVLLAERHREEA
ncbi:amino acid permease [Candidatus Aerophobetes bacterium]|nr:amino acid permease [Candidatus Aerophobetes bacterium]